MSKGKGKANDKGKGKGKGKAAAVEDSENKENEYDSEGDEYGEDDTGHGDEAIPLEDGKGDQTKRTRRNSDLTGRIFERDGKLITWVHYETTIIILALVLFRF